MWTRIDGANNVVHRVAGIQKSRGSSNISTSRVISQNGLSFQKHLLRQTICSRCSLLIVAEIMW